MVIQLEPVMISPITVFSLNMYIWDGDFFISRLIVEIESTLNNYNLFEATDFPY